MKLFLNLVTSLLLLTPTFGATDSLLLRKRKKKPKKEVTKTGLKITVHGLHGEPSSKSMALMKDAFLAAYNQVHKKDDTEILDFLTKSFETKPDDEDEAILETSELSRRWPWRFDVGIWWGWADFSCRFCANDDDALTLEKKGSNPMANIKKVEALFCRALDDSGDEDISDAHHCSIKAVKLTSEEAASTI